jgi:hypothetical protein
LTQKQLIEQQFAGFHSISDSVYNEVYITLPYLIDLYIEKNKTTITYDTLHKLSLFSRYLVDNSVKLEDYPVYTVRYSINYDYVDVPVVNPLSQLRTGKILYRELTNDFIYRFVVNTLPNSTTFDVYKDSNFVTTDVTTTFTFGDLSFSNWLQNNRFKDVKTLLETYFDANFSIKDMINYITLNREPSKDAIAYLSNSLELVESLV